MTSSDGLKLRPWLVPHVRPTLLARAAGVSPQYVRDVMAGKKPPSRKLLAAAGELGIPVSLIYGDEVAIAV